MSKLNAETGMLKEGDNGRYISLDVFRGLTIALMIVVNSPGNGETTFSPLEHAAWNGFTITDLVFPSFLFAVGAAMSFTITKSTGTGEKAFLLKVLKRTAIIILLGLFLNAITFSIGVDAGGYFWKGFSTLRLVCVLERIAFCYFIVALMIRYASLTIAIVFSVVTLIGYWAVMYAFGDQPDPYSLVGNAVSKLDLILLGDGHIWHGEGVAFDPEGLLSTWPSIVNVLGGYFAGIYLKKRGAIVNTVRNFLLAGVAMIAISLTWDIYFPLNKKIWTSSFVMITVGWDLVIMGVLIFVIDINRINRWTYFFEVFGRNPLALYILSYITVVGLYLLHTHGESFKVWIYTNLYQPLAPGKIASLMFALTIMLWVWLVGLVLDRRKIYIKV